jgi:hypothetical protein
MKRACGGVLAVSLIALCARGSASDAPLATVGQLAGNTLSAVAYVPRTPNMPGGGELLRIMLQAYLRADGRALVRAWDPARNAYTAAVERDWSLTGTNFCVGLPGIGPNAICADIHVWGPRIAGIGIHPYAMLDGDLQPGNALSATR